MFRILLPILFLFVSVGLNAQQVFYRIKQDTELPISIPLDTVWCKAKNIDRVVVQHYSTRGKKYRRAQKFSERLEYLIKDGKPFCVIISGEGVRDTGYVMTQTVNELYYLQLDTNRAIYNPVEQSYKKVWVDSVYNHSYTFTKTYFNGKNLQQILWAKGNMYSKYGLVSSSGTSIYSYNKEGLLTAITDIDYGERGVILNHKFKYVNGIVKKLYKNYEPGGWSDWVFMAKITYYSHGKKVKP